MTADQIQRIAADAIPCLSSLLSDLQPGGRIVGHEYVTATITGGSGDSCKTNLITGVGRDFAGNGPGWNDPVALLAAIRGCSMSDAAKELATKIGHTTSTTTPKKPAHRETWTPIVPVPANAPPSQKQHIQFGYPSMAWEYTVKGELVQIVCRFDPDGMRKQVLPLTFCRNSRGREEWCWQALPEPRPFYGVDTIGSAKHVVVVEGEKSTDAARRLLASMNIPVITWPGGGSAVHKADWTPLVGLRVVIWPDADKPGSNAALDVAEILTATGCKITIALPPEGVAKGWDAADAETEGWTCDMVLSLLKAGVSPEEFRQLMLEPEPTTSADHPKPETITEAVARLAKLSLLEYEQLRKPEAKRLGIDRVGALDKAIAAARQQDQSADDDMFPTDDPWHEPVDGAALIKELVTVIEKFSILPSGSATIAALWVVLTYSFNNWRTLPILAVLSPEKRCGKTTFLTTLSKLCHRVLPVANISSAALFRSIEAFRPTFLIDEGDSFLKENEELRGIINSGHTRETAFVIRCEGDDHAPTQFSTWCPKAIAMIGMPSDTISDRSVIVSLRRKLAGEQTYPHGEEAEEMFPQLRSKILRWVEDHKTELMLSRPARLDTQNDRQADNYRPLLAIAQVAGVDAEARKAARLMIGEERAEPPIKEQLLMDIKAIFEEQRTDRLPSADMVKHLIEMEDRPWCEWKHGKPLTAPTLARLLKPFGVHTKKIRFGAGTVQGYELEAFIDTFTRYTPIQTGTLEHINNFDELSRNIPETQSGTKWNRNTAEAEEMFLFQNVPHSELQNGTDNYTESLQCSSVPLSKGGMVEDIPNFDFDGEVIAP